MLFRTRNLSLISALCLSACSPSGDKLDQTEHPSQGNDAGEPKPGQGEEDGGSTLSGNNGGKPGKGRTDGGIETGRDAGTTSSDAGDGDAGTGPVACQDGACCIGGSEYLPGAKNPDNACQECDPTRSTSAFSAALNATCGDGCVCKDGRRAEAICNDATDNDGDNHLNCADADCGDQLCQAKTAVHALPSKDLQGSHGPASSSLTDGSAKLTLQTAIGGQSYARLEFDHIPAGSVLTIESALLNLYVDADYAIVLRGPDGKELRNEQNVDGNRTFDLTSLVKAWADGSISERYVELYAAGQNQITGVYATEADGTNNDPYIYLTYSARCSAGVCPAP